MSLQYEYDVLILGAGPGGYVAAIRASQLGMKVGIIEKDKPGGVCLNVGCIPSKALIHQAELFRCISSLEELGLQVNRDGFEYARVYAKSREAANTLSRGVEYLLKKNKVDLIKGYGRITGSHEISLQDGRRITGKNLLIATGSSPREIPGFPFDEERILSSTGALMLQSLPARMLILGGGAIGVEFAHIFNSFGVEIHIVEMLDGILPSEDRDTVHILEKALKERGIRISTETKALSVESGKDHMEIRLEEKNGDRYSVEADMILVAVGRVPNTQDIGLENVGITTEKGFIPVGDYYQTSVPSIFAIGDVVNSPLLAHVASKEGEIAVEYMAGLEPEKQVDPDLIPRAVYCEPQLGSFGYTEKRAVQENMPYEKAVFPYRGAGKAVAVGRPEGLVKVLYHPDSREILGAHIVGTEATELIHELLLAKSAELLPEDIATMIHAHPSLSEATMEAMRMAEGWAIHI